MVKQYLILSSMVILLSCISTNKGTSIDHVRNNKEHYSSVESIVHGFLVKDDQGNTVLSNSLSNKDGSINLAIPKDIYENMDVFYNKEVFVRAKYVEHFYRKNTSALVPSHLLISNIELVK